MSRTLRASFTPMITSHELLDLLRNLGIDVNDLVPLLAKKAGAKGAARLVGASKAVLSNLVRRVHTWREHNQLVAARENKNDSSDREEVTLEFFERWVAAQQYEAAESVKLLFRIVYLRALRAHCDDLPVVANLGFSRRTLNDIWVEQHFRIPSAATRASAARGEAQRLNAFSLEHAFSEWGPQIIIEGTAGSGKSTQLRKFVLGRINKLLELDNFDEFLREPIPVYLNASDIFNAQQDFATSLELAVGSSLGLRLPFPMPSGFFDRRQPGAAGRILLVVDGLNEVGASNLERLLTVLEQAVSESRGSISSIVSAWPLERVSSETWRGFFRIEVCDFNAEQASALATRLLGDKVSKGFLARQSRLPRSPMLLTLAALLQNEAFISIGAALYREFILALLKKRSAANLLPDDPASILHLLCAFASDRGVPSSGPLADIADELHLVPSNVLGLARLQATESLLIATGIVVRRGGHLEFIHYSFRSYLRALDLAQRVAPNARDVWNLVSPFREDWDCVTFVCEIWIQERKDASSALIALLAFGEPGLRTISNLASRFPDLPRSVVKAAVAKWIYRDDGFWDPGYVDGPVQQLTLIALNYDEARLALRQIARSREDFWEDSVYAARGLAEVGLATEATRLLADQAQDLDAYCVNRVLAVETLFEIGSVDEARLCLDALASEWRQHPPDVSLAEIDLGKVLIKSGKTRAGLSLLKKLSQELEDVFDKEVLSQAYAELGYLKRAAHLARAVFRAMEWSHELARGYRSKAAGLLELLEQIGLNKEASIVRKGISDASGLEPESLVARARNPREKTDHRLASAKELLGGAAHLVAIEALEQIACDWRAPSHERFEALDSMVGVADGRTKAIELLKRIAEDEPEQRVSCGKKLVLAGEIEAGCSMLRRIALEPADDVETRVKAICEIAGVGQLDVAAAGFRKLFSSKAVTADGLSNLADAFAHTSFWPEFLDHCEKLAVVGRGASIQIRAIEILRRSGQAARKANHPELLRKIVLNRNEIVEDRINAAYELEEHVGEFDADLLFDITTSADETMEMGLAAMDALYVRGCHFAAVDGGHDVVWDAKLTEDQFIQAAHHFIGRRFDEGEFEAVIKEAIIEALVSIASDASKPFERRLAAAGIDLREKWSALDTPLWRAVDVLVNDNETPIELRWCAILCSVQCDPSRLSTYIPLLSHERLSALQRAEVYRAAKQLDAAVNLYGEAIQHSSNGSVRMKAISRLAGLKGEELSEDLVKSSLIQHLKSGGDAETDNEASIWSLILEGQGLSKAERLELALGLARSDRFDIYEVGAVLETIADLAGQLEVQRVLNERLARSAIDISQDFSAYFRVLHLWFLQAKFGAEEAAAEALTTFSTRKDFDLARRIQACASLSHIGRGRDARACLRKCVNASLGAEELLAISRAGGNLHDWGFVRSKLRAIFANIPASPAVCIEFARELGRAGLPELARTVLARIDLAGPEVIHLSIEALSACGRLDEALELCRSHSVRPDVDLLAELKSLVRLQGAAAPTSLVHFSLKRLDETVQICRGAHAQQNCWVIWGIMLTPVEFSLRSKKELFNARIWTRTKCCGWSTQ